MTRLNFSALTLAFSGLTLAALTSIAAAALAAQQSPDLAPYLIADRNAEIALARLLAPFGWLKPTIPRSSVQRKPCAPGQYHASPTTTDPS